MLKCVLLTVAKFVKKENAMNYLDASAVISSLSDASVDALAPNERFKSIRKNYSTDFSEKVRIKLLWGG